MSASLPRIAADLQQRGEASSFRFSLGLETLVFPTVMARATPDSLQLIAKGLTVFDRVRPVVARAIGKLRSRLARK